MKMWPWHNRSKSLTSRATRKIFIPAAILDRTVEVLQQSGHRGRSHEGVVYWAGRRVRDVCFIMTCVAPLAVTTGASFDTSSASNARVVAYLAEAELEMLGQVHCHPGEIVDHSEGDEEKALMPYKGFLSVVVPHYARRGMRPLTMCGVHVWERSRFRRIGNREIESCFRIVDQFVDLRK